MKYLAVIFLINSTFLFGQDYSRSRLDSLYNMYTELKSHDITLRPSRLDTSSVKCGFGLVNSIRMNFDLFTPGQKSVLQKIFAPPVTQKNVATPSGFFRVHYDTSGINAIKYDLKLLLEAIDSSYNYEVKYLGYPPPPRKSGEYNIYIQNIGNMYGYTETDGVTSFIVLDNDFSSTATRGINGARVTIAHELHHAIQLGNYTFAEKDIFFHELTSTAMEEFVFDSINDYYYYMDSYFNDTDLSFPSHNGYDLAIWNIFLEQEFDHDLLIRQWEYLVDYRAMDAIALSINERGSNFQDVFNRFGIWTFHTGYRKIPGKYFEEGGFYPVAKDMMRKAYFPPSDSLTLNAQPVSHNYITFFTANSDTLTIIISNSDFKNAIINPSGLHSAFYELFSDSLSGGERLTDDYYYRFTPGANPAVWATSEFLNNQLIKGGLVKFDIEKPFPSPFRYSEHNSIYIPVKINNEGRVDFSIFSSSMNLVYDGSKEIFYMFGKNIVMWDGRTTEHQKLGTGVYIYVIKSGEELSTGKIVLFNE